jgi:hypothetical protein
MPKNSEKFDVTINFEGAPDTTKMNKLSEEDVDRLLTTIPPTKLAQGRKILLAMDNRDQMTEEYKKQVSIHRLKAASFKEELNLGSDKDREAWVTGQKDVVEAKKNELTAILEVKLQEYMYQYLEDMFISARKQANKYEKALDADMQNARYGNRN